MNKAELIDKIAQQHDLSKNKATDVVNAVFSNIADALSKNEDVALIGLGTFDVRSRAARDGRNPKTGEVIKIAASKTIGFKAGKPLKDAVQK